MSRNTLYNAVSFRYALLDLYKKLQISEQDLVVILMIDHLLEQGNLLVTADVLSMKMNYSVTELDKEMVSLVKKGFLVYDTSDGGMKTSLDPLKNLVYGEFHKLVEIEQSNLLSKDRSDRLGALRQFYEKNLERSLTPLENQTMGLWLEAGYSDEEIRSALQDALRENKKTVRGVDKILKAHRTDEDMAKEGTSMVSPSWDKDIEKTIEIAKKMWNADDSKK
jgi:DNA replication protein